MLKKTITYTDLNGVEKSETHYFHLNEAKRLEMQMTTPGGMAQAMQKAQDDKDEGAIYNLILKFVHASYGIKSDDGVRFFTKDENGTPLIDKFKDTEAYSKFLMDLLKDEDEAADFLRAVAPGGFQAPQTGAGAINKAPSGNLDALKSGAPAVDGNVVQSEPLPRDEVAQDGPQIVSLADVHTWDPQELRDKIASGEVELS